MRETRILFLCIHNSARSQMAEAYLKKYGGKNLIVESAGLEAGKLNPFAVEAMKADNIDISDSQTKSVFDLHRNGNVYDYVITVCDEASAAQCPVFPGKHRKLHWNIPDPSALTGTDEEKLRKTIEVRERIKSEVKKLVATLE